MSDIAIRVENLSKRYRIGLKEEIHDTMAGALGDWLRRPVKNLRRLRQLSRFQEADADDILWALRDVSFEVKQGEVVGVIGRNGAGKSTLLKILSRITYPTSGRVELNGRVSSLLEVGTGFHPELTGRENIYLNGTILGMTRREIDAKFDEIVDFSGVEKFIDTPVKRFSSGMRVRLAFSVAAHLEPEILLIDEVLAVGDAEFQKKCLGKMGEVAGKGRTLLFVSHNMQMIARLCERTILLGEGVLIGDGASNLMMRQYLELTSSSPAEQKWDDYKSAPGDDYVRMLSVKVLDHEDQITETHSIVDPVFLEMNYLSFRSGVRLSAIFHLYNEDGICLFASNDFNNRDWWRTERTRGTIRARCKIPGNFLAEGRFFVLAGIGTYNPNHIHAIVKDVVSFVVVDRTEGDGVRGDYSGGDWPGVVRPLLEWELHILD